MLVKHKLNWTGYSIYSVFSLPTRFLAAKLPAAATATSYILSLLAAVFSDVMLHICFAAVFSLMHSLSRADLHHTHTWPWCLHHHHQATTIITNHLGDSRHHFTLSYVGQVKSTTQKWSSTCKWNTTLANTGQPHFLILRSHFYNFLLWTCQGDIRVCFLHALKEET